MAEHILQSNNGIVMRLRYDTYTNWMNSDRILQPGEAAIAVFPHQVANRPPKAVGIKIGNGRHYFEELPWIQALAADVYDWAKYPDKPTYSATEISGLAEYIQQYAGGSGGGSGGGMYQIVYDINTNKYILQVWNESTNEWENTLSEIDFSDILNRINNIERWANGASTNLGNIYDPIGAIVYDEVIKYINKMDVTDTAVAHEFVTSVSETDGKISVTRSIITAADITSGVFPTLRGGTGLSRVEDDEVLVGSNSGNITTKTFVTEIDVSSRNSFATVGAIIDYVTAMTAGLTGAMHFSGEATVAITHGSRTDPQIVGYTFRNAQPGDVILANEAQEFVWTGSEWRLLGDEGSYVIKGSITNADIAEEANIAQSKIAGLDTALEGKVDKVEGKGLSTNDYTTEEKDKLHDIEADAQVNIIEHVFLNDDEVIPTTVNGLAKSVNLQFNGMSEEQSQKLDGIEAGAQVNTIESIKLNGTTIAPDANKAVNIEINEFTTEEKEKLSGIESGAQTNIIEHVYYDNEEQIPDEFKNIYITSDPHTEHINKIEHIYLNNTEVLPTTINGEEKSVNITIDAAALDLTVLEGAVVPNGNTTEEVDISQKKLLLARIAKTGDISNLLQTSDTYVIFDCGTSTEVI